MATITDKGCGGEIATASQRIPELCCYDFRIVSGVGYFFGEGAAPPGTVPWNLRISPFRPTAQPW